MVWKGRILVTGPPPENENKIQDREGINTMFLVQEITIQVDSITTGALALYNKGSKLTMIRNELAEKLGLQSRDVKQKMVRSGRDVKAWDTKAYNVCLMTKDWEDVVLLAMGVDEISLEREPANVKPALKVFPQIPNLQSVRRLSGKVDLLIGLNYLKVQQREVAREGGLSL